MTDEEMPPEIAQMILQGFMDGWESFEETPIIDMLPAIARALGTTVSEIMHERRLRLLIDSRTILDVAEPPEL
jgi:hypothetical protein